MRNATSSCQRAVRPRPCPMGRNHADGHQRLSGRTPAGGDQPIDHHVAEIRPQRGRLAGLGKPGCPHACTTTPTVDKLTPKRTGEPYPGGQQNLTRASASASPSPEPGRSWTRCRQAIGIGRDDRLRLNNVKTSQIYPLPTNAEAGKPSRARSKRFVGTCRQAPAPKGPGPLTHGVGSSGSTFAGGLAAGGGAEASHFVPARTVFPQVNDIAMLPRRAGRGGCPPRSSGISTGRPAYGDGPLPAGRGGRVTSKSVAVVT